MVRMRTVLAMTALAFSLAACDSLPSWMGGAAEEKPKLPGERITVLPVDQAFAPDEQLKHLDVALPPANLNAEWPQATGVFNAAGGHLAGGEFSSSDSATAGDGEEFGHTLVPRPVVGGGLVFAMDAAGNISAHDVADIGNVRWESPGLSEEDESDLLGGGLAFADGKLYAVSGHGGVGAFDAATGKALWRAEMSIPFRSAPVVALGRVMAVTIDSQLMAFDANSSKLLWAHRGIDEVTEMMNAVSPAVSGGMVLAPYDSGEIYALGVADGAELWNESLLASRRTLASGIFSGIGGDPVIDNEIAFAVGGGGTLAALHMARGQRLWERPIASLNTPWMAGDFLFVLSSDNTLLCLVKYDGRIRWATKLPSYEEEEERRYPISWRGPVLTGGRLAVAGSHGEMVLVSAATGEIASRVDIADGIVTAPVVAGGKMYLVSRDATLYSLQ